MQASPRPRKTQLGPCRIRAKISFSSFPPEKSRKFILYLILYRILSYIVAYLTVLEDKYGRFLLFELFFSFLL